MTSERLTLSRQIFGRISTGPSARRGVAVLCLVTIGFLWWQLASSFLPDKVFGYYSVRVFSGLVVLSYLLLWGCYFALSRESFSGKAVNFCLTAVTLLIIVGLLEIPSLVGLVDYRNVIAPPQSFIVTNLKPWDNPANILDKQLMHIHRPGQRVVGETKGDLVNYLGIATDRTYRVDVQFDRQGFRNDHQIEKAPVIVLGDSFVEGILVKQAEVVATQLKDKLGVEVANLGQSGYGPQQELLVLQRFGLKLEPKVVLWFFFEGNDLLDVPRYERFQRDWDEIKRNRDSFRARSFMRNLLFTLEGYTAPGLKADNAEAQRRSCLFSGNQSGERTRLYFAFPTGPLSQEDLISVDKVQQQLLEAQKLSSSAGAQFLFIYVPTKLRVYSNNCEFPANGYGNGWQLNDLPQKMEVWSRNNGVSFLDLTPALKARAASGELVYFPDDGHWNANGHLAASDAVARYLGSNNWLASTKELTTESTPNKNAK